MSESGDLNISTQYDDELNLFVLTFFQCVDKDTNHVIFQVKMLPSSFESMSNDMIRTIKNYNLFHARNYLETKKDGRIEHKENGDIKNV